MEGRQVLMFWYRNNIYAIESRSPAEGAYSEGFIKAKFTQVRRWPGQLLLHPQLVLCCSLSISQRLCPRQWSLCCHLEYCCRCVLWHWWVYPAQFVDTCAVCGVTIVHEAEFKPHWPIFVVLLWWTFQGVVRTDCSCAWRLPSLLFRTSL